MILQLNICRSFCMVNDRDANYYKTRELKNQNLDLLTERAELTLSSSYTNFPVLLLVEFRGCTEACSANDIITRSVSYYGRHRSLSGGGQIFTSLSIMTGPPTCDFGRLDIMTLKLKYGRLFQQKMLITNCCPLPWKKTLQSWIAIKSWSNVSKTKTPVEFGSFRTNSLLLKMMQIHQWIWI